MTSSVGASAGGVKLFPLFLSPSLPKIKNSEIIIVSTTNPLKTYAAWFSFFIKPPEYLISH